jgi:hypothetical protein
MSDTPTFTRLPGDLRTAARISAATADAGIAMLPAKLL